MEAHDAGAEADNNNRKLGPVTIYVDFAKSAVGISFVIAVVTSLIGFICVETATWHCSSAGPMRFFGFVSMTSFWGLTVLYFAYLTGLVGVIRFIAWDLTTMIWASFDFIFYLIASALLAAAGANCNDAFTAGAVFGFLSMPPLGVIIFFKFREYRKRVTIARGNPTTADIQHKPEGVY